MCCLSVLKCDWVQCHDCVLLRMGTMMGVMLIFLKFVAVFVIALMIVSLSWRPMSFPPAAMIATVCGVGEANVRGCRVFVLSSTPRIELGVSSFIICKYLGNIFAGHLLIWDDPIMTTFKCWTWGKKFKLVYFEIML